MIVLLIPCSTLLVVLDQGQDKWDHPEQCGRLLEKLRKSINKEIPHDNLIIPSIYPAVYPVFH